MNELDKHLLTGETVIYATTKHWFAPIRASIIAFLLLLAFAFIRMVAPTGDGFLGTIGDLLRVVGNGALIVAIAWIIYNIAEFVSAHFGVTNMRVLRYEGIIRRRSSETLLPMLTDVRLDEPAIGRLLGYGNLRILTSSGAAGEDQFMTVKDAAALRTAIQEQKAASMSGAGTPPAVAAPPPAVAAPPPAVAAPPPPTPTTPPPPVSAADDAAAALTRLADLHAQGLITDADYEAKKTEILGRI